MFLFANKVEERKHQKIFCDISQAGELTILLLKEFDILYFLYFSAFVRF